jgi:hypothetical protein
MVIGEDGRSETRPITIYCRVEELIKENEGK